jgi:TolB protein
VDREEEPLMKRALACGWVALCVGLALALVPAEATPPGENGRIAYRIFFNTEQTRAAIFTINPDGSDRQQVTHPRHGVRDLVPDWSADGRWIVYVRSPSPVDGIRARIWKIHPDGTGRERLSRACKVKNGCAIEDDPAWSPDGTRIAYSRVYATSDGVDLMLMHGDGTHVRHVTHHKDDGSFADWNAQWSPNGRRIVFARSDNRVSMNGRMAIFTIRPSGSGLRRISPWDDTCCGVGWPDWSPDGQWIVFTSPIYAADTDLWLVRPDGSDLHKLTDTAEIQWLSSSFSPDGTMIVAARTDTGFGDAGHPDVYVMNVDGTEMQNITQTRKYDSGPDWGPG